MSALSVCQIDNSHVLPDILIQPLTEAETSEISVSGDYSLTGIEH